MNVTSCPAVVFSTPRKSAARQPSSANVGFLYSSFHGSPPEGLEGCAPVCSLNSSFVHFSHRHRRPISTKKVSVVRARSSAFDSDGDKGFVQKKFAKKRDESDSKLEMSWVSDDRASRAPQKQQHKAAWAESRDFWSSAASLGSPSGDFSSPNNQQRAFSPSQTLLTNSNLTRKQQIRVIKPSDASRLQNRLPAFRQAAEPDAFGAFFSPVRGADAFTSLNGQSPSSGGAFMQKSSSLEDGSSQSKSVSTCKLEEILNKFRTREKQSSSRDDLYGEGRRNGAAPSALPIHNEDFQATRSKVNRVQANGDWSTSRKGAWNRKNMGSVYVTSVKDDDFNEEENAFVMPSAECDLRAGMRKGNAGGLFKREGAPSSQFGSPTLLPWEDQEVSSASSEIQSPIRKRSSNIVGAGATNSSQSSVLGNNGKSPNLESRKRHWSSGVEKSIERVKHSNLLSISRKDHGSEAIVSEFDCIHSDEEDNVNIILSINSDDGASLSHSKKVDEPSSGSSMVAKNGSLETTTNWDDGASSSHSKKANQPSSSSSMAAKNGSLESTMKGKIAPWHSHSNPNLPFEFQYSYSETPKAPIIRYREEPYSPFGPDTMGRPWTGRAPLNKSKKKRPEFDSFKPPPVGKKGIKFVQSPGPFPKGQGPAPARSREEILGEPLTGAEVAELVDKCQSERRQLNLGRDGLTHNMLDLIHCHWKRRRVIKIKCLGVPTVDMDNVCFHLEDKTGGKIIYRTGGVVYLFRGRNYNYRDRPEIPLMLWKPISPVYPRLIKRAPVGLTVEEADKLRLLAQKVEPLCTLAKNGVYLTLVKDVRAAFRVDDLVRIDCRGLNPSDYKKIGAKLRDLVPCVLLSFNDEQILMWKGKAKVSADVDSDTPKRMEDTIGSEVEPTDVYSDTSKKMEATNDSEVEAAESLASWGVGQANMANVCAIKVSAADNAEDQSLSAVEKIEQQALVSDITGASTERSEGSILGGAEASSSLQNTSAVEDDIISDRVYSMHERTETNDRTFNIMPVNVQETRVASDSQFSDSRSLLESNTMTEVHEDDSMASETVLKQDECSRKQSSQDLGARKEGLHDVHVVRVDALWDQAFASGIAIQLDDIDIDGDVVVKKASELDAVGEYTRKLQGKLWIRKGTTCRPDDLQIHFANLQKAKLQKKAAKRAFRLPAVDVPDNGGLPLEELARLLSVK